MAYNREQAIAYAHRWAYGRNPRYADFSAMGGDCTNFISQCIYEGCGVMNPTPVMGWYYYSLNQRAAAWTSVPFLYQFLLNNSGIGPYSENIPLFLAQPGDVIQLSFDGEVFAHSLLVVETGLTPAPENILIATHTFDADNRPLASYQYAASRLIHIIDARG